MKLTAHHAFTPLQFADFDDIEKPDLKQRVIEGICKDKISKHFADHIAKEDYLSLNKTESPFEISYHSEIFVLTPALFSQVEEMLKSLKDGLSSENQDKIDQIINSIRREK